MLTIILAVIVVLLAVAVAILVRRNRRNVKKAEFLFNALDNGDYSFRFNEQGMWDSNKAINAALNRVKEILQHARDEQMEKEKYFELILDSVDTGILVVDKHRGLVLRSNAAAQRLLQRDAVTHINQVKEQLKRFSVHETHTTLSGRQVRIMAISDIGGELANQEIDSWVRLIRVLTHEIMNTLTPVISLSEALLPKAEGEQREALEVIHHTSKDLIGFVENYRKFTHVPTPQPTLFYVKPFLERMAAQTRPLIKEGVAVNIDVAPHDLLVYADESLITRVMTNLLKNAGEATANGQHIWLKAYTNSSEAVIIDVSDNGEPIPADIVDHIFIPFFTTKASGSGIGLSLSRQIMRVSNGSLTLVDRGGAAPTTFRLTFA